MTGDDHSRAAAIATKLQQARKLKNVSLRDLASKADMSASMLSQIEHGKAFPSVRSIYNIAEALGLPVDYFFPNDIEPASATPAEEMTASDLREAQLNGTMGSSAPTFAAVLRPSVGSVLHAASRPVIELKGGVTWARLTAHAEQNSEFLEVIYAPEANSGISMSHHEGREFGLVLEGELVVELGFERHELHAGDSIIFDSTTPHRLTNCCTAPARAVWVVLAPDKNM
jgi:transcriptional regulator with XRE-family HTH domain